LTSDLQDSVRTDVPLTELLAYASFARGLTRDEIHQVVLQPPTYSENGTSPDGTQEIVIPNWSAIDQAVAQMFQIQPNPAPGARAATNVIRGGAAPEAGAPPANGAALARPTVAPTPVRLAATATATPAPEPAAAITVLVENGTTVPGLGQRATKALAGSGFRLSAPVNAGRVGVARTTVTFYQPEARDAAYGVARLTGGVVLAGNRPAAAGPNVVVVLGTDAAGRF